MNEPTPAEALQLLSEALEPKAQGQISRAGYIAIQKALEVLAAAIKKDGEDNQEIKNSGNE
jgi:hypothetical protein